MAESGQTVRILFLDGQERLFTNVSLDSETAGWLYVMRLDVDSAPLSGIVAPIAGYRLEALKGWEYVQETGENPQEILR